MSEHFDLVVRGGTVVSVEAETAADIGIRNGRVTVIGDLTDASGEVLDARGLHVLPGVIDTQVHFREPGLEHKEDLASGTAAAALGGVTAVFEMPNTQPPTTTETALADKLRRAHGRAWVDYAFYVGASADNVGELPALERLPGCCGIKVFMGSSTGSLLVPDDETLAKVLRAGKRRVAVHAEDEPRLIERKPLAHGDGGVLLHPLWRDAECARRATARLLDLARAARRPVHVLHVSTAEEMALLAGARDIASVEVTPQHLTLAAPDCYQRLGAYAQMNPPIRDSNHREALWRALAAGVVDVIGSDHAPHSRAEKDRAYPDTPSGMPGVQTLVPIMLDHLNAGRLTLARLVELTSAAAARLFGIEGKGAIRPGRDADLTLVDLKARRQITDSWIRSKCGWTPFAGMTVTGWPKATVIRGRLVMRDDQLIGAPGGQPIQFRETEA